MPTGPGAERRSSSGYPLAELSVLVIEDDPAIAEILTVALEARGYQAVAVATGQAGLLAAATARPDLVILDLGLPDMDGVEVCRRLRSWSRNPIIVLSADGAEERKLAALDHGADDYVTKPFSMPELLARLRVAERHRHLAAMVVDDAAIVLGDVIIDTAAHVVSIAGVVTQVPRKEFALLALLARNAGKVLTHAVLLDHVWGDGKAGTGSLRVLIAGVRRRLGTGPGRPSILSAAGTGYRLVIGDPRGSGGQKDVRI